MERAQILLPEENEKCEADSTLLQRSGECDRMDDFNRERSLRPTLPLPFSLSQDKIAPRTGRAEVRLTDLLLRSGLGRVRRR